jgi:hypothetical protein
METYLAAVNSRNWPKVWQLGGKNLGPTYGAMVAGFRKTRKDILLSFKRDGDHITAVIAAYEINGAVQDYALHYVIQRGIITGGYGTLL